MNKQAKIFIRTSKKNYRKLKTSKKIWLFFDKWNVQIFNYSQGSTYTFDKI